jgi:hypothetical protein
MNYIYLKIRIKSKRQTPQNGFALIEKRYHKDFRALIFPPLLADTPKAIVC